MKRYPAARLFPLVVMLSLALLTFWLERIVREEERHPALRRHDPDYMIDRFSVTRFDADGRPESILSAERMVHYPDDDTTELLAPRIVQARYRAPRVTLSANRGALSQDGEETFLSGDVLVVQEAGAGEAPARIRTEFLHLLRERSLMRTDREVSITEAGRVLEGRGMDYNSETRVFRLHAEVRGRFDPGTGAAP